MLWYAICICINYIFLGTADAVSNSVYSALVEMKADKSVQVLGSDTTNTMSGAEGGAQHYLEVKLNRNVFRVLCNLHTNELPLRQLFKWLDGDTSGKDSFKGPIGKALKKVKTYKVKETFPAITAGDSIPTLSEEVTRDLSWDQKGLYKLLHSTRDGKSNSDIINMALGGLCHSRFTTLAENLLYLNMCEHDLSPEDTANLETLVYFIMTNFGPMWFAIKMKPLITDAPKHVFLQTKLMKLLPDNVQTIVKPFISKNAYYAHPEPLLLAMLDDDNTEVRKQAVDIILNIRRNQPSTSRPIRSYAVPTLLYDADSYNTMIDWNAETLTEPPLTYHLTDDEINHIVDEPLSVPPYRAHTQSIERAVKLVTEASGQVYELESARGFIRSQVASRQLYIKADSRKELIKMVKK